MDKSECCELCYEKLFKIDINEPYYRLYSDIINVFMSSGVINIVHKKLSDAELHHL